MYYSDEIIEEVRSRNDIVDVISTYVKLQKKGSSYFGLTRIFTSSALLWRITLFSASFVMAMKLYLISLGISYPIS